MKRQFLKSVAAALTSLVVSAPVLAADITGAGATFPFPIYAKWAEEYKKATGTGLNYQSIGSSGGIRQIRAKTVTFGATDAPVPGNELDRDGMVQFPAIIGGTVPIFNVDGFGKGELRVTGPVLAEMFMGKISRWNDPKLAALNPGKNLPNQAITVVHRADGSGTTFLWTDYLSKANAEFKDKVGTGNAVKWPTGVGGKGNEGVAANVQRVKGAFGYVEYAYAKRNKIPYGQMKNRDGEFVMPDDGSFKAAAAMADWANTPGMGVLLTNQPGKDSWPATGASFILMHKTQADALTGRAVLKFFDWAFKNGGQMATELEYVPIPAPVVKQIQDQWKASFKDSAGAPIWK